jgi:hypothetical protein
MVEDTWKRAALLGRWEHSTAILWSKHQALTTCDAPAHHYALAVAARYVRSVQHDSTPAWRIRRAS